MKRVAILLISGVFLIVSCERRDQDNDNYTGDIDLKIGKTTEIKSGETAYNAQYGLSLRVVSVNDGRCPEGVDCMRVAGESEASVEFQLTTKKGEYNFTLNTYQGDIFKSDTIIEGSKYQLRNILPYPVSFSENQSIKTVRVLVDNDWSDSDGYSNATVMGKGLDCGNSFAIVFDENVTGLPSPYRHYYEINLPEEYKIKNERISVKFRKPDNDELMVCTMMGATYPQIYIVEVK